jgi:hypothetical protein
MEKKKRKIDGELSHASGATEDFHWDYLLKEMVRMTIDNSDLF